MGEAYPQRPDRLADLRRLLSITFASALICSGVAYAGLTLGKIQAERNAANATPPYVIKAGLTPFETAPVNRTITARSNLRGGLDQLTTGRNGPQRVRPAAKSDFNTARWRAALQALTPKTVVPAPEIRIVPVSTNPVPKPRILPEATRRKLAYLRRFMAAERHCLAQAIYFEARSEPTVGQVAVANVVFNRVSSEDYPNTICQVVFQNYTKRNACQFSFACDGKPERGEERNAWRRAVRLARKMITARNKQKPVRNATHYHADYVRPDWSYKLKRVKKIGRHIFYWNRRAITPAG
jgi:spore germination cell wall hydrolase CwlJ-like protein